jgi:hypothetical protein
MKFFFPGRAMLALRIAALLLLIQSHGLPPFSPAGNHGEKAGRTRCGCLVTDAASGRCGCAVRRCCNCCKGFGEKAAPACHQRSQDPATIYLRVFHCGGQEEVTFNSYGEAKFFLTDFTLATVVRSAFLVMNTPKKPDSISLKPHLHPPEVTNSPQHL